MNGCLRPKSELNVLQCGVLVLIADSVWFLFDTQFIRKIQDEVSGFPSGDHNAHS
jgi:hypothetical protein